jgi:uncharacterized protein YndB with AHSA1/START domain
MTLTHATISLDRQLNAPVERVFAAWRETAALDDWCCPGDGGWTGHVDAHEFAVGGEKRIIFGPEGATPYVERSRYLDILPDRHIINSERITKGEELISASKIALEFTPTDSGCTLTVTDQLTLLSEEDNPEQRRGGWIEVLDKLQAFVAAA